MALFLSIMFFIIMILIIYWDIHFNRIRNLYKIIMIFFIISSINVMVIMGLQSHVMEQHKKTNVIIKTYDIEDYNIENENDEAYLYFRYYENGQECNKRVLLNPFETVNIKSAYGILKYTYIPGNDNIWFPVFEQNIFLSITKSSE